MFGPVMMLWFVTLGLLGVVAHHQSRMCAR